MEARSEGKAALVSYVLFVRPWLWAGVTQDPLCKELLGAVLGGRPALSIPQHNFQEPSKPLFTSRPGHGEHFLPWGPAVCFQPTPNILPNGLKVSHSTLSLKFACIAKKSYRQVPRPRKQDHRYHHKPGQPRINATAGGWGHTQGKEWQVGSGPNELS